jgi:prophage regulatory protein
MAAVEIERLRSERAPYKASKAPSAMEAPRSPLQGKMLLRISEVCAVVGLSRSSVYAKLRGACFPRPVRLSERAVRWRTSDLDAWLAKLQASDLSPTRSGRG